MITLRSVRSYKNKMIYGFFICFSASLMILAFSLFQEFFNDVKPCFLCKVQRGPYFAILLISLFGLTGKVRNSVVTNAISACLIVGCLLASYHLLIQLGLFTDFCALPSKIHSLDEFEKLLASSASSKSCAKISWAFLGLPLSFYNILISGTLLIMLWLKQIIQVERSDR